MIFPVNKNKQYILHAVFNFLFFNYIYICLLFCLSLTLKNTLPLYLYHTLSLTLSLALSITHSNTLNQTLSYLQVGFTGQAFGEGLIPNFPSDGGGVTALSMVSTTAIPFNCFLASAAAEGYTMQEMRRGIACRLRLCVVYCCTNQNTKLPTIVVMCIVCV